MLRVRNLQVDIAPADHDVALAWWADALGGTPRSTDEPEYTHLDGVRAAIGVHVQRLVEGPGRFHLDLETDGDVDAEVARLVDRGATDVGALPGGEPGRILADPAGLVFCITTTGQEQHLDESRDLARLFAVVFDVPAGLVEAEARFWAAVVGGHVVPPHPDHPEFRAVRGLEGPGGRLGVLVQELGEGSAAMHVDLYVPDEATRDAEVERLVGLGATVATRQEWVVLRVPGGHAACIVPALEPSAPASVPASDRG